VISIRQHLTRRLLLALGLLFGGGLATIYYLVTEELVESFDRALLAKAQAISTLVTLDGQAENLSFSDKFMRGFDREEAREFFEIWREDGTSVQRSESLGTAHLPNRVGDFKHPVVWTLKLPRNQPGRALGVEFVPRGSSTAATLSNTARFHLVVAARSRGLDKDLREILLITGVSGVLLLTLTALLVPWLLKCGLRPLESLAEETEKINAETLTLRFPTSGVPPELMTITERLNALLVRLEQSFERERRVSAAMAHELRTPIAELRSLAECALKWPEARDPEIDRDALAIARQMETVVTHMLTLSRSETGQLQPNLEPLDLAHAVVQAWNPFEAPAKQKNCALTLDVCPMQVSADPVLVRSILSNLMENAVEYSPGASAIKVTLTGEPAAFSLAVSNSAPDLTQEDVARLFERFWRKEQARTGGRHAGLGLSLSRAFALVLGWEITPQLDSSGVLTLTLSNARRERPNTGSTSQIGLSI
jgi:signal transduction histidine kinase